MSEEKMTRREWEEISNLERLDYLEECRKQDRLDYEALVALRERVTAALAADGATIRLELPRREAELLLRALDDDGVPFREHQTDYHMNDRLPIVPLPPQVAAEAMAPPSGWWRDGFLWRLKWGAEGRILEDDGKGAKAVLALAKSPRFQRFAEYFFATDAQGRCRFAVRPLFHPTRNADDEVHHRDARACSPARGG
jgi:hypothetical protein